MSELPVESTEEAESVPPPRWRIPALVRSSAVYGLSAGIGRGMSLLLLPILTRYVRPAEYGLLVTLQIYLAFGSSLFGTTTQATLPKAFFKGGRDAAARLVPNLLAFVFAGAALGVAVMALIVPTPLVAWMHLALPPSWLLLVPLLAALEVVWSYHLATLRFQDRPVAYACSEVGRGVASFSLALLLLIALRLGWQAVAIANAIVTVGAASLGIARLRRAGLFVGGPNRTTFRMVATEALTLVPHALGSYVIALADRLMLGLMYGRTVVGIYGIGYSLGASITLVTESINRALGPRVYRDLADPTPAKQRTLVRITYLYGVAVLLLAVVVTLGARWLLPFVTAKDYHGAVQYVGWIAFAFATNSIYSALFPYLVHAGATAFLARATAIAALVNVLATYLLVSRFGPVGAAMATLLAYAFRVALVWHKVGKVIPMPWAYWRSPSSSATV